MTAAEPRFAQPTERVYTARDVRALTGATYRQIDYWCSTKALIPQEAPGSGYTRHFTAADVDVIYAAIALARFGLTVDAALDVARELVANNSVTRKLGEIFELTIAVRPSEPS